MPTYRVFVYDASSGTMKAALPFSGLTFNRTLSACGQGSFTVPVDHPNVTIDNLGVSRSSSDREITVFRDDVPVINGPITAVDASLSQVTVTFREASWYLYKRVLEVDKSYDGYDLFDALRDLVTYMTGKLATGSDGATAGSSIVASIPRFTVASGTAGVTITDTSPPTFYGSARHLISDCWAGFAADPDTGGFEWRMDYLTGSTLQSVQRTIHLGSPNLGSTLTAILTDKLLDDFQLKSDWDRGATRVHVIGATSTSTLQSTQAVTDSILLTEKVADASNLTKASMVASKAKDLRRLSRPPVRVFQATFRPSSNALAYNFCDLGDTIPFAVTWPPILSITGSSRRVIDIATAVADDGDELVTLTFNDVLTDTGA